MSRRLIAALEPSPHRGYADPTAVPAASAGVQPSVAPMPRSTGREAGCGNEHEPHQTPNLHG